MIVWFGILQVLILGAGAMACYKAISIKQARSIAIVSVAVVLGISIVLLLFSSIIKSVAGLQSSVFGPQVGLVWVFNSLVAFVAVSLTPILTASKATFGRMLLLSSTSLAALTAYDPIAIAILWLISYVIILRELREHSDIHATLRVFNFYHVPSVLLVLCGALSLYLDEIGVGIILLTIGILIREAVMPFHSWFPTFYEKVPRGLVVIFFCAQLGVLVHFQLIAGVISFEANQAISILGGLTSLLAAALSSVQKKAKRALAFLIMSQSGLVVFGMGGNSFSGMVGSMLAWQAVGLSTAALTMTFTALESRRSVGPVDNPQGSFARTPRMAVSFLILGFASIGLPATIGFVGEDLILQGSVVRFPVLGLFVIGTTALNGISVMRMFFSLFCGTTQHGGESDFTQREWIAISCAVIVISVAGIAPQYFLDKVQETVGYIESQKIMGHSLSFDKEH